MKNRCEVTLENQGRSLITSGFVARELQDGFSVLVWAEEYYPRPRRIGFTKKPYSWKNFAQLLSRPNPFMEFYDEEVCGGKIEKFYIEEGTVEFFNNKLLILSLSAIQIEKIAKDSIEKMIEESKALLQNSETKDKEKYILSYKIDSLREIN